MNSAKRVAPEDAPTDGQRVVFYVPLAQSGEEEHISAVYNSEKSAWLTTEGAVLDVSIAVDAFVVGFDPE